MWLPQMNERVNVVFVGQTGVGKSSLINMIRGIPDHSQAAARVGRSARAVTLHTACYSSVLTTGLQCQLWDTQGLDATTDDHLIVHQTPEFIYYPTIFMWCIQTTKIDFPIYWQQLHKAYVEYCHKTPGRRKAIPVIVITQMAPNVTGWELKCRNQIRQLGLRVGHYDIDGVLLLRVRKHRGASSPEYTEDSKALRDHISQLAHNPPTPHFPAFF